MSRTIDYARRHVRSIVGISLASLASLAAVGIMSRTDHDSLREAHNPDAIFLGLAYKSDLAPYKDGDDAIHNLKSSTRIVTDDLSKVAYLIMALDEDGIKNASLTFNGRELRSTNSENPRDKGIRTYGVLHSGLANTPGNYVLEFTVTDQNDNTMVQSAIVELKSRGRLI